MKLTPEQYKQLKEDMVTSFRYFKLPPDVCKVAYDSAMRRTTRAYRCYRAIVRSL